MMIRKLSEFLLLPFLLLLISLSFSGVVKYNKTLDTLIIYGYRDDFNKVFWTIKDLYDFVNSKILKINITSDNPYDLVEYQTRLTIDWNYLKANYGIPKNSNLSDVRFYQEIDGNIYELPFCFELPDKTCSNSCPGGDCPVWIKVKRIYGGINESGKSANFTKNSYIKVPHDSALTPNQISILAWVYPVANPEPMLSWVDWLPNWNYRRAIRIYNPNPETLRDYQVKIYLNDSIVGSNFNWISDKNALRFTARYSIYKTPIVIENLNLFPWEKPFELKISDENILEKITYNGRDIRIFSREVSNPYSEESDKVQYFVEDYSRNFIKLWVKERIPAATLNKGGYSLSLPGESNSYVETPLSNSLRFTNKFSISMWLYPKKKTIENWWNVSFYYRKKIKVYNPNNESLGEFQVKVENPYYNESGLVLSYHFEKIVNGRLIDSSYYQQNDGLVVNANLAKGVFDNCINLTPSGTNDYVIINPVYKFVERAFTIAFWIKTSDTRGGILSYATSSHDNEVLLFIGEPNPGELRVYIGENYVNTGILFNDGVWHFVVVTWNSTNGNLKVYVDGVRKYQGTFMSGYTIEQGGSLVLGQDQDSVGGGFMNEDAFEGYIDELRIYDRVLSEDEIIKLYRAKVKLNYYDVRFTQVYNIYKREFTVKNEENKERYGILVNITINSTNLTDNGILRKDCKDIDVFLPKTELTGEIDLTYKYYGTEDINGYQMLVDLSNYFDKLAVVSEYRFKIEDSIGNKLDFCFEHSNAECSSVPPNSSIKKIIVLRSWNEAGDCSFTEEYKYLWVTDANDQDGSIQDADGNYWYEPSFNDSSWKVAKAPFRGNDLSSWPKCTLAVNNAPDDLFVRKWFYIPNNTLEIFIAKLYLAYDDGIRCYINGHLVVDRIGESHTPSYWNAIVDINTSYLHPGLNLIACWVANGGENSGSGSGYFDAKIIITARLKELKVWVKTNLNAASLNQTGSAFYFDGSDDYINIGKPLANRKNWSIVLWIKTTDTRSGDRYWKNPTIIGVGTNNPGSNDFGLEIENGFIGMYAGLHNSEDQYDYGPYVADGNWHFIAVVNDGKRIKLYLDGKDTNVYLPSGKPLADSWMAIGGLGADHINDVLKFEGYIDEVRLYSKPLTFEEILNCFEGNCPEDSLVAYYTFEHYNSTHVFDEKGNFNGTINGNPTPSSPGVKNINPTKLTLRVLPSDKIEAVDGDKVFDFYDDFNSESLDTSKWALGYASYGAASYSFEDGKIKLYSSDGNWRCMHSKYTISGNDKVIVETRFKLMGRDESHHFLYFVTSDNADTYRFGLQEDGSTTSGNNVRVQIKSGGYSYSDSLLNVENKWYIGRIIKKDPTLFEAYIVDENYNRVSKYYETRRTEFASHDWWINIWTRTSNGFYWDWVRIRKYIWAEPILISNVDSSSVYVNSNEYERVDYKVENCYSNNTKIYIKIKYLPPNGNIDGYLTYGNLTYKSDKFNKLNIVVYEIVDYFEKETLQNTHHNPRISDIYSQYWSDAGRDAFDGYGRTYLCSDPTSNCQEVQLNIDPPESGGSKAYEVTLSNGAKYIIYKDMPRNQNGNPTVLRIVILPSNDKATESQFSVYRYGNLGSDSSTHSSYYTFDCNGKTYRFVMTWDYSSTPGSGDPNIFYFMVSLYDDYDPNYFSYSRSGDRLYERLDYAKGITLLYLSPSDNPLNDMNIKNFLCEEIKYFSKFSSDVPSRLEGDSIVVPRKSSIKLAKNVTITLGSQSIIGKTEQELNYYIERDGLVWIRVPLLPKEKNITIYMYYGNREAKSSSNGTKVFDFFDDFEGSSLDSNVWTTYGTVGSYEVENGYLKLWNNWGSCCDGSCYYNHLKTFEGFDIPITIDVKFKQKPLGSTCGETGPAIIYGDNKAQVIFTGWDGSGGLNIRIGSNYQAVDPSDSGLPPDEGWHIATIKITKNNVSVWRDWTNDIRYYSGSITSPGSIGLAGDTDSTTRIDYIDWIRVRKYSESETISYVSQEEETILYGVLEALPSIEMFYNIFTKEIVAFIGGIKLSTPLKEENWSFIVVSFDSDSNKAYLYVNGKVYDVKTSSYKISIENNYIFFRGFYGYVDEVRLYNKSLTKIEIINCYKNKYNCPTEKLKLYYSFDAQSLSDDSGNGNHGTPHGYLAFTQGINGVNPGVKTLYLYSGYFSASSESNINIFEFSDDFEYFNTSKWGGDISYFSIPAKGILATSSSYVGIYPKKYNLTSKSLIYLVLEIENKSRVFFKLASDLSGASQEYKYNGVHVVLDKYANKIVFGYYEGGNFYKVREYSYNFSDSILSVRIERENQMYRLCIFYDCFVAKVDKYFGNKFLIGVEENSGILIIDKILILESVGIDQLYSFSSTTTIKSNVQEIIPHYIEYWNSSSREAYVWIKVPFLRGNSETIIYMYYGNPSASSSSNGDKTFDFFDNFDDYSFDNSKWKVLEGLPSESNGYLRLTGTTKIVSNYYFKYNYTLELKVRHLDIRNIGLFDTRSDSYPLNKDFISIGNVPSNFAKSSNEFNETQNTSISLPVGSWYKITVKKGSNNIVIYKDENKVLLNISDKRYVPNSLLRIYFETNVNDNEDLYVNYVYVRKYSKEEPYVFSIESEETPRIETEDIENIVNKKGSYGIYVNLTYFYGKIATSNRKYKLFSRIHSGWNFIALTYDGNYARIYLDGKLVREQYIGEPLNYSSEDLFVGLNFFGRIDELRIYNVSLSHEEIKNCYSGLCPSSNLVLYYDFDDETANDKSGSENNGIIYGGVSFLTGIKGISKKNTTIFATFGNSPSKYSGKDVFEFYDDFSSGVNNLYWNYNSAVNISNAKISDDGIIVLKYRDFDVNYRVRAGFIVNSKGKIGIITMKSNNIPDISVGDYYFSGFSSSSFVISTYDDGSETINKETLYSYSAGYEYLIESWINNGILMAKYGSSLENYMEAEPSFSLDRGYVGFMVRGGEATMKFFLVRKSSSYEPYLGGFSVEKIIDDPNSVIEKVGSDYLIKARILLKGGKLNITDRTIFVITELKPNSDPLIKGESDSKIYVYNTQLRIEFPYFETVMDNASIIFMDSSSCEFLAHNSLISSNYRRNNKMFEGYGYVKIINSSISNFKVAIYGGNNVYLDKNEITNVEIFLFNPPDQIYVGDNSLNSVDYYFGFSGLYSRTFYNIRAYGASRGLYLESFKGKIEFRNSSIQTTRYWAGNPSENYGEIVFSEEINLYAYDGNTLRPLHDVYFVVSGNNGEFLNSGTSDLAGHAHIGFTPYMKIKGNYRIGDPLADPTVDIVYDYSPINITASREGYKVRVKTYIFRDEINDTFYLYPYAISEEGALRIYPSFRTVYVRGESALLVIYVRYRGNSIIPEYCSFRLVDLVDGSVVIDWTNMSTYGNGTCYYLLDTSSLLPRSYLVEFSSKYLNETDYASDVLKIITGYGGSSDFIVKISSYDIYYPNSTMYFLVQSMYGSPIDPDYMYLEIYYPNNTLFANLTTYTKVDIGIFLFNQSIPDNIETGIYKAIVHAFSGGKEAIDSMEFKISRGIFDVRVIPLQNPAYTNSTMQIEIQIVNRGEHSQDVVVKYGIEGFSEIEETLYSPFLQTVSYIRDIDTPPAEGTYYVYVNLTTLDGKYRVWARSKVLIQKPEENKVLNETLELLGISMDDAKNLNISFDGECIVVNQTNLTYKHIYVWSASNGYSYIEGLSPYQFRQKVCIRLNYPIKILNDSIYFDKLSYAFEALRENVSIYSYDSHFISKNTSFFLKGGKLYSHRDKFFNFMVVLYNVKEAVGEESFVVSGKYLYYCNGLSDVARVSNISISKYVGLIEENMCNRVIFENVPYKNNNYNISSSSFNLELNYLLCVNLLSNNSNPIYNATVEYYDAGYNLLSFGKTDENGMYCSVINVINITKDTISSKNPIRIRIYTDEYGEGRYKTTLYYKKIIVIDPELKQARVGMIKVKVTKYVYSTSDPSVYLIKLVIENIGDESTGDLYLYEYIPPGFELNDTFYSNPEGFLIGWNDRGIVSSGKYKDYRAYELILKSLDPKSNGNGLYDIPKKEVEIFYKVRRIGVFGKANGMLLLGVDPYMKDRYESYVLFEGNLIKVSEEIEGKAVGEKKHILKYVGVILLVIVIYLVMLGIFK